MIPLQREKFPDSKAALADAMDESLRQFVHKDERVVSINSRVFPYLDEIAINFDGAKLEARPPAPPTAVGETKSACETALLTLSARKVSVQGAPVNVQLEARDVVFHEGRDADGKLLLLVKSVRTGNIVISASQLDLEHAIGQVAQREARKNGINIEQTRVSLRARGPRSISADVRLEARKLLFRAKIDISGQLHVDDEFVARISNLICKGEGAVGSIACGILDPHLRKLEGQTFSLMSLPLGEVKLRDVRIAVGDTVEMSADFGSAQEA
ncbi:MAG: hypothetical protein ABJB69_01730 [Spartobacteria bacterium]